jgi:hypothetical protein
MMTQFMVLIAFATSENVPSEINLTQSIDAVFKLLLTSSNDADFVSRFCEVRLFINGEWNPLSAVWRISLPRTSSSGVISVCSASTRPELYFGSAMTKGQQLKLSTQSRLTSAVSPPRPESRQFGGWKRIFNPSFREIQGISAR